ncbi:hypothetical protein ACM55F_06400 [Flavobacterium sp. XS2P12]|uniref:hypothetical protein n=1 Tax=Flavobacterium melibiosi TaxID=3398734 RepID=UPI003A8582B9
MKKVLIIGIVFLALSCSVKKNNKDGFETISPTAKGMGITKTESEIINDFLEIELEKDRYKPYKNYRLCFIKEGISKLSSLLIYEYCYTDRNLPIKNSTNNDWILNEVQIKNIKDTLITKTHHWNVSDFTTITVSIIEHSELTKSIKENNYTKFSETLILNLSTPLLINDKNAFITFNANLGWKTMDRFTALLKKNKEGKWEIDSYYYDPNSTW